MVEQTEVLATPFSLQIVREVETLDGVRSATLLQSPAMADNPEAVISLRVTDTTGGEPERPEPLTARSFAELRRKYPRQVRDALRPIFSDLGAAALLDPDAREAWQVLAPLAPADAAVEKTLAAVLSRLDADSFAGRQKARRDLADLGQPAAVALMRRTEPFASAEQRAAVEAFLAGYRPLTADELKRRRQDVAFLLDVLGSEDRAVSHLALQQLRTLTGKPLPLNESLDGEAREQALAAVRSQFLPLAASQRKD